MFEVSEIDGCRDLWEGPKVGVVKPKELGCCWKVIFSVNLLFGCTKITIANEQGGEASTASTHQADKG